MSLTMPTPDAGGVPAASFGQRSLVVIVDDDADILDAFRSLILLEGHDCATSSSAQAFLDSPILERLHAAESACVLCDVKMPEMDGLQLQQRLKQLGEVPMLLMSGASGAQEAVTAFRAGALDFLIKPIDADQLLHAIARGLSSCREARTRAQRSEAVATRLALLSSREREVADLVVRGLTNLGIALELGITERTVKFHRQRLMDKLGLPGTTDLVRLMAEHKAC